MEVLMKVVEDAQKEILNLVILMTLVMKENKHVQMVYGVLVKKQTQ